MPPLRQKFLDDLDKLMETVRQKGKSPEQMIAADFLKEIEDDLRGNMKRLLTGFCVVFANDTVKQLRKTLSEIVRQNERRSNKQSQKGPNETIAE